jgi:hypothetical protein
MISIMPPVYQTNGKWLRSSAIEFSDTTRRGAARAICTVGKKHN